LLNQTLLAGQRQNKPVDNSDTPITIGTKFKIASKRLNEERTIEVYFPRSYHDTKQRFPVIYTLDGEGTGSITASAVGFMTGYSTIPQMPEALVVAINNTDRDRDMPTPQEYNTGGQANFLTFITDELIPLIDQKYRTQPLRVLLGHSQGGLFTTYAMATKPDAFRFYLSIDAPLGGFVETNPIKDKVKTLISKTPNYHGRMVSVETVYGWRKEWQSLTESASKGFKGAQIEIKDESHETMAYKAVYEGLKRLFNDYAPNLIRNTKGHYGPARLDQMYAQISEDYGYKVDIPKSVLLIAAEHCTAQQYAPDAIELIKRAVELYGESQRAEDLMMIAQETVKKGRDPRLDEWENLPMPTVDQMKPFLGVWIENRRDGSKNLFNFEVKDGVVNAEHTGMPNSDNTYHLDVSFVKVIDSQTLQWAIHNGRGPGMEVYTGKLTGPNSMEGTVEDVGFINQRATHNFRCARSSMAQNMDGGV